MPEADNPLLAGMTPLAKQVMPEFAQLLYDMGVLADADAPALRLLCEAFAEGVEARSLLQRLGSPYYETHKPDGDTMYRAHPAVAMAADADRRFAMIAGQFGLTPAARAKVSAHIASKTANPFESI
jgi:P27 family predicted phage terminase small subunit